MVSNKTLIKNSLLFSIAPFLPKIINVLLLPIMTAYLTDVDFGIAGTISAYTNAIGAFATLGLTVVLMNSFFKTPLEYKEKWRNIYGFLNIWMIVYAVVQSIILFLCVPEEALDNRWWIILLSQFNTVLFGPTGIIGNSYFIYNKESVPVVWRSVVASILTILVDFVLIVFLKWGYMGWYVGTFVGQFFTNASYWFVVNKKIGITPSYKFNVAALKRDLSVSLPTIPHYYTNFLLEGSGRLVLDQYHIPQGEIGKVSISQQVGDIFQTGISGLNNAISPYCMSALKENNENRVNILGVLFSTLIFFAAFILSIWSKEIFRLLLANPSLQTSYPYFILYVMACCYRPLYLFVSNYYFYYEHTKQLLGITFVSGLIALAIYICLVPFWGIWAFLIGHYIACIYYGYSGFLFRGYRSHSKQSFPFYLFFICQIVLTVVSFILVDFIYAKIIVTLLLGIISCIIFFKYRKYVFQ